MTEHGATENIPFTESLFERSWENGRPPEQTFTRKTDKSPPDGHIPSHPEGLFYIFERLCITFIWYI